MNKQDSQMLSQKIMEISKDKGIDTRNVETAINLIDKLDKETLQSIGKNLDSKQLALLEQLLETMK
ncbi:MAG: hypothetical protein E7600_04415 [Ruminococcaceae bacterium]|nr:hypothetical protein [Oscillospiraceae bacterium]